MTDALIERLAGGLTPVRPFRPAQQLAPLAALVLVEAALIAASGALRPMESVEAGLGWWKLIAPLVLAASAWWLALRAAEPSRWQVGARVVAVAAAVAAALGLALAAIGPADSGLRPAAGLSCVAFATACALPAAIASALLLRRAAPARTQLVALLSAVASGATGAALLGLHCSDDHATHSLVWHSAAVLIPAGAALLPLRWAARW